MSVMGRLPVGSAWLRGVAGVVMVRVGDGGLSWDARERVGCGERSGCWVVEAFAEPDLVVDGEAAGVADREGSYAGDEVGGRPVSVAVSYTHLRAHATVLDLVCRLLLEKKK